MLSIEGQLVQPDGTKRGRVEIDDKGIITSVGPETGTADIILKDELIFPGFIDVHIHARECSDHSQDYKEDFKSAGEAAINGGVVAFADMPNNPVAPIDEQSYAEKFELTKNCPIEVVLYGGIGPKTAPFTFSGKKVPFKVFMGKSVGELFFENSEDLERVLKNYTGQSVSFHCEDPKILSENQGQSSHEGQRPEVAEIRAVDFALGLIRKYSLSGKICHVSTAEALEKINEAKKNGTQITVEITPHHLYFDLTMLNDQNRKLFQVNPPLRQSPENRLRLIAGLKNGDIDFLATDHAPHTLEEKQKGISGLAHLDTFGLTVSWLMKEHGFSAQEVSKVCSINPGDFFSSFCSHSYGRIEKGYTGSLTVIDSSRSAKVEKSKIKSKAQSSPFEGLTFPGAPTMTIIKGQVHKTLW